MADLEARELEYFVAVAEELHFGRAAVRLSIAQPALSKAIRRVESRLRVQLLVRNSRAVSLTPAGEALLRDGRHALKAVAAAALSARRAGQPADDQLRLVIKPGGDGSLLSRILAEYAVTADARPVEVLFGGAVDRADQVHDGRADLALLYAPFDDLTGLAHETLVTEPRVVIVSRDHRLAQRDKVRLADLAGETLPRWLGVPGGGSGPDVPAGGGPELADVAQLNQLIALGRTIAVLPRSLVEPLPSGLVCVPVTDAQPSRLVLAWSQCDERPIVASFVAAALRAG